MSLPESSPGPHSGLARPDWTAPDAGRRYAERRWANRRSGRDPRQVAALLAEHLPSARPPLVLDAPCGSGRLAAALARFAGRPAVALDAAAPMLAGHPPGAPRLRARIEALPFADDSFDAVVACRLLHHLSEDAVLDAVLAELLRVSRGIVVASFWSSRTWPGWRRARGLSAPDAAGRCYRSPDELRERVRVCGGHPLDVRHAGARLSSQAFLVARPAAARSTAAGATGHRAGATGHRAGATGHRAESTGVRA